MNITLSISEEMLRDARDYAEKHGTSVNQMVREHLSIFCKESERQQRVKSAMEFFENMVPTIPAGTRITREELEER